jgi:hypothetical protein
MWRESAAEIERDALREKARLAQLAKEERAKKAKFDHLPSIKDLSLPEFADMRKRKMYDLPRNSNDLSFHRREQQLICTELYAKLTHKVCPQKVVDFEHLRKSDYFKEALWITRKLGLHPLMQLKQDYNILLVHQFFATLVFGDGEELPMTWMTGDQVIHSNFIEFAEELGYPFKGNHMPCGTRMHLFGVAYNKKALAPLYGKLTKYAIDQGKKIVVGDSYGLRTRYNILLRLFCENIAPSAGNLDALRGGLVNLLAYSHEVFCKGQEAQVEPIDVMDFVHREIYECILSKKAPVYAPYVMKLIKRKSPNYTLCVDISKFVEHKAAKPQKKLAPGVTNEPFAATSEDEGDEDMEGEEDDVDEEGADGEEEIEETRTAPPSPPKRRSKNTSNVPFPSHNKEEVNKEIKKLS